MLDGFELRESAGPGLDTTSVARMDGAIALNGAGGSVAVCIDRFWQNFPKAYTSAGNSLEIGLWPAFGNGPMHRGQYGTTLCPR